MKRINRNKVPQESAIRPYVESFKEIRVSLANFNRHELLNFVNDTNELIAEAKRLLSLECSQVIQNIPKEGWREILVRLSSAPFSKYGNTEKVERLLGSLACVSKSFSQLIDEFVPVRFKGYEEESTWTLSKCILIEKIDFKKPRNTNFHEDLLKKYTNLRELVHPNYLNRFTGESLKNLSSLTKFDLRLCHRVSVETLSKLTSLESLDIRRNGNHYLAALKNLPYLKSLRFDSNTPSMTSNNLKKLTRITSLEYSIVDSTALTFCRMPHLRTLIISGDEYFPSSSLAKLSPDITTLVIKNSEIEFADDQLRKFKNLTSLTLSGDRITNEGIEGLTKLSFLDISECDQIDDGGIMGLRGLTELHVNSQITDEGLKNLPNLTRLDLKRKFTRRTFEQALYQHADMCNDIITNEGLNYLKNLKFLSYDATYTDAINKKKLKETFPNLEIDPRSYEEILDY